MITFNDIIGKMTIKQHDKEFSIDIQNGNCLAVFNYRYIDERTGDNMVSLYNFFMDEGHCKRMMKNMGNLFSDEVTSIELNLFYKPTKLLNILTKAGYKVTCYYKEPKDK